VLGKPFWGKPTIREEPSGGLSVTERNTDPAQQDDADEVLISEGLGHQLLSIPGMDNYFTYQLEYKRVSGGGRGVVMEKSGKLYTSTKRVVVIQIKRVSAWLTPRRSGPSAVEHYRHGQLLHIPAGI
jgi:hypothetical protein